MQLIDNVNHRLGDDLKVSIKKGSKLSIAASAFSIFAFETLNKELEKIDELLDIPVKVTMYVARYNQLISSIPTISLFTWS